jgi:hypothetical protein
VLVPVGIERAREERAQKGHHRRQLVRRQLCGVLRCARGLLEENQ